MDDVKTWQLIHAERAAVADTLHSLSSSDWAKPSLCGDWSIQITAGHILAGAEQTKGHFMKGMVTSGFRFNALMDREAHRMGSLPPAEIVSRLRARTTTTNRPPAPVVTMLGEVVVHSEDIRGAVGQTGTKNPEALVACLEMYKAANFPLGTKKRIDGLRLVANDLDWTNGTGDEVSGPGLSILMAMTGRAKALDSLTGDGLTTLRSRMPAPN
jgi:uncharacterized protein (TIGR03083 family)